MYGIKSVPKKKKIKNIVKTIFNQVFMKKNLELIWRRMGRNKCENMFLYQYKVEISITLCVCVYSFIYDFFNSFYCHSCCTLFKCTFKCILTNNGVTWRQEKHKTATHFITGSNKIMQRDFIYILNNTYVAPYKQEKRKLFQTVG